MPAQGPCETVLTRKCVHHSDALRNLYPHVRLIQENGVESYCGVPIVNSSDHVVGHLAVMDSKPMPDAIRVTSILGIFVMRAAAELERLRMEAVVKENEAQLRDLFDEAPLPMSMKGSIPSLFVPTKRP